MDVYPLDGVTASKEPALLDRKTIHQPFRLACLVSGTIGDIDSSC